MGALASLPNDIFIEGLGEVAKSGFIMDPEILRMLEDHADELRSFDGSTFLDSDLKDVVAELIERAVTVKAYHVSADLKEAGLREFLNYGHTLGHAIEKLEHFRWRHGNAVAVGCVYAAELSICSATSTRIWSTTIGRCSARSACRHHGTMAAGMMCWRSCTETRRPAATDCVSSYSARSAIPSTSRIRRRTPSRRRFDASSGRTQSQERTQKEAI
mgnify:CR=1 FL=1